MIIGDTATALYGTLVAGTALTALLAGTTSVYHGQASEDATFPYVVFNHQGGGPIGINPSRIEDNLWYVRAYSVTSMLNASNIFTQVDTILHRVNITITGATTIWCQRESNVTLIEMAPNGKPIYSCGGMYRIMTTNT